MHRHHHLFERIAALENLIAAGRAALRGKRLASPLGFVRAFPPPPFRCGRRNSRIFSEDQAIPTMARPALNVPRPSPRQKMSAAASAVR
jgi:hypothetical protein